MVGLETGDSLRTEGTFRHMDLPFVYYQLDRGVTKRRSAVEERRKLRGVGGGGPLAVTDPDPDQFKRTSKRAVILGRLESLKTALQSLQIESR
ncbi:hypothetical protein INR49_014304, partial [Caranx melampygus]